LLITPFVDAGEGWLRADLRITVIHERLVAEYGFTGHYQRVKMFLTEARARIAAELAEADDNSEAIAPLAVVGLDQPDKGPIGIFAAGPRMGTSRVPTTPPQCRVGDLGR
jgi:hypothetical protein